MEYQYITFKPERKKELNIGIKEFQELHPEINFYAFFCKYSQTSGILKNNVTAKKMFLASLAIPDGIPIEICTFLRDYVDYQKSNIKISVTLKNIAYVPLYKGQEINLTVEEGEAKKPYLAHIISAYKVNTVNGLESNEFLQRRKIYLETLGKIENNSQMLYAPQSERIKKQPRDIKVLLESYFEKFTKEEIKLITQLDIIPVRKKLFIDFANIPDEKLVQTIECFRGKENIILRISSEDKQRILDRNISFKDVSVNFSCNLVSEAQEDFISRFNTGEITISPMEINATTVNINRYKILLRRLRKIVKGISLDEPEEVRFKKVYTRLAKNLEYDYKMVEKSQEFEKYQEENVLSSRNLVNSLLIGKCICAGMAETLKQALSLVNINCLNCTSQTVNENDEEKAHMYSLVKINGQWYNADLTWDSRKIRNGEYPKFCLKSDDDFNNVKKEERPFHTREECDKTKVECNQSLELFKKEKAKKIIKNKLKAIKRFLIKYNIIKERQLNNPLLPEISESNAWKQSVKVNQVQSLGIKSEEPIRTLSSKIEEKKPLSKENEKDTNSER